MEDKDKIKYVFDIEADNLLDNITKIHCLAYCDTKTGLICSTSYQEQIKDFFLQKDVIFIGHNIVGYDVCAVEKIFNIKVEATQWDTLALSWLLNSDRKSHSLENWGIDLGIKKIEISDWENLDIKDYILRCETDVKINYELWKKQASYLNNLYEGNHQQIIKYLNYIHFKLDCVKEHQEIGVNFDTELAKKSLEELEKLKEEKITALKEGMPKRPIKSVKNPPKVMFKQNGEPSENRIKWLKFLEEQNLPPFWNEPVEFIHSYEEPNPDSHQQIKDYLFSLGWIPEHFKYVREEGKREMRKIPQIKAKDEEDGSICPSILRLIEKDSTVENLDSLFIISHRIGLFKGFLRDAKESRLYQSTRGFSNTNRLMHSGIVNLPLPHKKYAENVRKSFIADEGKILIGSDLKNIESRVRDHFIYPHDPDYVNELSKPTFDSHIDICVLAGFLTKEQGEDHVSGKANYKEIRQKGKTVNFAAVYGVGKETLSRNSGLSVRECEKLLQTYWKRNWAVKKVAEDCIVKELQGQKWLYNPISEFWVSLRAEKDRFSSLAQSTAVYIFDRFLFYIRQQGIRINMQMHDEWTANLYEDYKESVINKVETAIKQVNDELKLNIEVGCSYGFGTNYTDIH